VFFTATLALAQPPAAKPPATARAAAPIDLTGTWVSVITEDWRWRMVTPLKGDAASIPINAEARKVVDAWDPAKDEAAGEQCKSYGAPAIMRVPGRVRIAWQDDNTLRLETDAGQQTRLFRFGAQPPAGSASSIQGFSSARWEPGIPQVEGTIPLGLAPRSTARTRSLEVVTTVLRPGYLRKNGVPYSANATLREHYDLFTVPNGDIWFMVTTIVEDRVYLGSPYVTTSHFKKVADGAGWSPSPCTAR
jgi:hypothetical protein